MEQQHEHSFVHQQWVYCESCLWDYGTQQRRSRAEVEMGVQISHSSDDRSLAILLCSHIVCTSCIQSQRPRDMAVVCPICNEFVAFHLTNQRLPESIQNFMGDPIVILEQITETFKFQTSKSNNLMDTLKQKLVSQKLQIDQLVLEVKRLQAIEEQYQKMRLQIQGDGYAGQRGAPFLHSHAQSPPHHLDVPQQSSSNSNSKNPFTHQYSAENNRKRQWSDGRMRSNLNDREIRTPNYNRGRSSSMKFQDPTTPMQTSQKQSGINQLLFSVQQPRSRSARPFSHQQLVSTSSLSSKSNNNSGPRLPSRSSSSMLKQVKNMNVTSPYLRSRPVTSIIGKSTPNKKRWI
ncbi:hypothetical protein MP228_005099 [Amoeboaphelidium protococcarum]|nr:hypothetical protein MP228_005099 [Amoeboaphelidium protococcarum]